MLDQIVALKVESTIVASSRWLPARQDQNLLCGRQQQERFQHAPEDEQEPVEILILGHEGRPAWSEGPAPVDLQLYRVHTRKQNVKILEGPDGVLEVGVDIVVACVHADRQKQVEVAPHPLAEGDIAGVAAVDTNNMF